MFVDKDTYRVSFQKGLKSVLDKELPPIKDDETFKDYGLDSLDRMNLLLALEDELGINIGDINATSDDTLNSIYEQCVALAE
ncbi:MAG: acyl carrier protein [Desulfovibrio sp.]